MSKPKDGIEKGHVHPDVEDQTEKKRAHQDVEARLAEAVPGVSIEDLVKWGPVISVVVKQMESAIETGAAEVPVIKVGIHHHHLELGPTPVKLVD